MSGIFFFFYVFRSQRIIFMYQKKFFFTRTYLYKQRVNVLDSDAIETTVVYTYSITSQRFLWNSSYVPQYIISTAATQFVSNSIFPGGLFNFYFDDRYHVHAAARSNLINDVRNKGKTYFQIFRTFIFNRNVHLIYIYIWEQRKN